MTTRKYGNPPFSVAALHGGPGAPGYMFLLAQELAKKISVLEPLQSKNSITGQIQELQEQLLAEGNGPFTLVASSWGAVLALLFTAKNPTLVKKLILIGCATFDAQSSLQVRAIRQQRMSPQKHLRLQEINKLLETTLDSEKTPLFKEMADICFDADCYEPITKDLGTLEFQPHTHDPVWAEYVELRDQGKLAAEFAKIKAPTLLIHGDHDPHVIEGVEPLLRSCIPHLRLEWLEKCGHYPWIEKHAKDKFYEILAREI